MSSAESGRSLSIEPRNSRLFTGAVVALHTGAFALTLTLPVPAGIIAMLILAIVVSCACVLAGAVFRRRPSSIIALEWQADGRWRACRRDGGKEALVLMPDSFVHPALLVLNFRPAGVGGWRRWRRRSVVLLPDSADRDTLRRLRARLRLEGAASDPH